MIFEKMQTEMSVRAATQHTTCLQGPGIALQSDTRLDQSAVGGHGRWGVGDQGMREEEERNLIKDVERNTKLAGAWRWRVSALKWADSPFRATYLGISVWKISLLDSRPWTGLC
jgi:hypothetical protein